MMGDQVLRHRRARRHGLDAREYRREPRARRVGELRRGLHLLRLPRHLRPGDPHAGADFPPARPVRRARTRGVMDSSARRMALEFRLSLGLLALLAIAPLAIDNPYWLGEIGRASCRERV